MNLNEDFINIQGIFLTLEKSLGVLKKIKYRGGNGLTILNVITELQTFLSSKNYIKNNSVNDVFEDKLKDIVLFLILNTELSNPLNEPGCEHLINIMPQISTCLLANIVIGLDLSEHYCKLLQKFSLEIVEELIVETIPCLKKCKADVHIKNACIFLRLIVSKLTMSTKKEMENADKLTDRGSEMLLNLTGLHGDEIKDIKIDLVYKNMGYTVLHLLDLLLICDENHEMLTRMIEKILQTCCSVMMAVTLDVFCCWAEIEEDGQVLQTVIAGKSYMFIEKYQKYPPAKELIGMLGTIAQKPKTIHDLIYQANTSTMISMINKADKDQKLWLRALLNTQVLKCKDSIKCVNRWAHLCSSEDVSRLLSQSVHTKDSEAKKLVVKCASTLDLNELISVITRHFYQSGINNLDDDVQQQIVLLFNKLKDTNVDGDFSKELFLLLLQNPEQTLTHIFAESLKNSFYLYNLKNPLKSVKEIANVNNVGIRVLIKVMECHKPNEHNSKNYVELLNTLTEINLYSVDTIVTVIILPVLKRSYTEKDYVSLKQGLEILSNLNENIFLKKETECFYLFLFELMKNCRCKFLEFDLSKQEVVKHSVELIVNYCNINQYLSYADLMVKCEEDTFVSFYKKRLFNDPEYSILMHMFPCNFENSPELVTYMIKILPLCVTQEWLEISSKLIDACGPVKTVECLCDSLILLCHLINSQETKTEEVNSMLKSLKYCFQNFGIVLKERIQSCIQCLEDDIALTKNVCRLLKDIPPGNLKSEEGLSLASLLSDMSLSSLRSDKKFACLVHSINESHICKMLAQKILK